MKIFYGQVAKLCNMFKIDEPLLLVNFGGPRDLQEIPSFLTSLLQDKDVVRTRFPQPIHNLLFGAIARRRAKKISEDYEQIGARSPIYFDTESIAALLREKLEKPIFTFHRYLPATHKKSLEAIEQCEAKQILTLPLFPQFCYATTGSIARFFSQNLSNEAAQKLRWVPSYADHPAYVFAFQKKIRDFLHLHELRESNTALLFSAHGVPKLFTDTGDIYQSECERSFKAIKAAFPNTLSLLSYQSKFGRGEWIRPYTDETCKNGKSWADGRTNIVVIPLSFTSDHIETLFEVEQLYLPLLRDNGFNAYRCPALNLESYWIESLVQIAQNRTLVSNSMLVRT